MKYHFFTLFFLTLAVAVNPSNSEPSFSVLFHRASHEMPQPIFNDIVDRYRMSDLDQTLLTAVMDNNSTMAKEAIQEGARINIIDSRNDYSLLHYAINHPFLFKRLIDYGANLINLKAKPHGYAPLHLAVKNNNPTVIDLLLKAKADPNIQNHQGATPLYLAVGNNNPVAADLLLKAKADPNIQNHRGRTPLHLAAGNNSRKAADLLLKAGADPNIQTRWLGSTPLYLAVRKNYLEMAKALLQAGANPNTQTRWYGTAPLRLAVKKNYLEMAKALLQAGANPDFQESLEEDTLLHLAVKKNNLEMTKALLNAGANPDIQESTNGKAPIHLAVERGQWPAAKALLEAGANPNILNWHGETLFDLAKTPQMKSLISSFECRRIVSQGNEAPSANTN